MKTSPTLRLLIGLLVTLAAVTVFSWSVLYQLSGLRTLQTNTIDRNRRDSLQLLRAQNDINTLGLALRDMTDTDQSDHIADYRDQFGHLRADLEDAIRSEAEYAPVVRLPEKQERLRLALQEFWKTSDDVFAIAHHDEPRARELAATKLSAEQAALATLVSLFLERNNEAEERADEQIASIYSGVERNIYAFLTAMLIAIVVTSLYLTYSNRRLFERLELLSSQRRVLAARLITVQEEVLRSVSRELHDEFGQILTAVGAMLTRAERKGVPADSPLRTELAEIRQITQQTLEKMRSLSQMLHPAVIDDYGLVKGIEWYTEIFERQTGITTTVSTVGEPVRITGQPATHCFRIVQEALNNAAKHSGTKLATVEMVFTSVDLTVNISDEGHGMPVSSRLNPPGLGLIAMQERAELLHGSFKVVSSANRGTTVSVTMPLRPDETTVELAADLGVTEVVGQ